MAISYVSSASAAAATVAMPSHQAGDLILVFAFVDGSTTNPSLPSGYASVTGLGNGANTCSASVGFKWAQSSSETTGTFTAATGVVVHVYRGVTSVPVFVRSKGTGTTITHPALTLSNATGSSWVVRFCGHRTATNLTTNTPAGFTARTGVATEARGMDTNGGVTTANSVTQSVNASSGWEAWAIELRGDGAFFAFF